MPLATGARLGAYEVLSLIGTGGMGEVYKARDTRLDRIVALKILGDEFARDANRRARFEREAHAVAALSHPHICQLFDVGEFQAESLIPSPQPLRFLVMEHLEGQTLEERLVRGPLPMPEVLRIATELADALDHAHRRGLIHRDLKPGNVMLTGATGSPQAKTGPTKLLDFGISKQQRAPDLMTLPTITAGAAPITVEGTVVGTYPYMAPEQLAGRETDARSDIFAFGAIVYEMATGRRAFEGTTAATVIGAILHKEPPPISSLQTLAPPGLDRLVARALAKDPDDRWQTMRDLTLELKFVADHTAPPASRTVNFRRRAIGILASVLAIVAAGAVFGYARRAEVGAVTRLSFDPPDGVTLTNFNLGGLVAISPDGRRLAFVGSGPDGRQLLWVRSLDSLDAQALTGTDGASYPFWSPNGESIGFFAQGKLKKIQAQGGGLSQTLADAILPRGGTWSRNDVILFGAGAGHQLNYVSAGGGTVTPVPADGVNTERYWPSFLPDGRHFTYFARPQAFGIYVAALDPSPSKLLMPDYVSAVYASGYLLALIGPSRGALANTLMAQRFDATRLELVGSPEPVADQVGYYSGSGHGPLSVSDNGTLVYQNLERRTTQLMWTDRRGNSLGNIADPVGYEGATLAPDDQTVVAARVDPNTFVQDLWLIQGGRGIPTRLTSQPNNNFFPIFSPDGARMVFTSARHGSPPNLHERSMPGDGTDSLLLKSSFNTQPTDWSRDGRYVVYASLHPTTQWDLWILPMEPQATRQPSRYLASEFNEHQGRSAPDGRWLAYVSDESGRNEVYVQTFPKPGDKQRISFNGGTEPRWRRDGRELFYLAPDGTVMSVSVTSAPTLQGGPPQPLFKIRTSDDGRFPYDDLKYAVAADGKRFLVNSMIQEPSPVSTYIVLNWPAAISTQ